MNMIHTDKEGNRMLIAEMNDKHLVNTINFQIRRLKSLRNASTIGDKVSKFDQVLYGIDDLDEGRAAHHFKDQLVCLSPYIIEAYVRGLDESAIALGEALGRDKMAALADEFPF